jgi:hypothetical protein
VVTVLPSDQRTRAAIVTVILRILPASQAPRPVDTADRKEAEEKKKKDEEKKEEVKQPPVQPPVQPAAPPPPGCVTSGFGGQTSGSFNWSGVLPPGQTVTIQNRTATAGSLDAPPPPDRRAVTVNVDPDAIEAVQGPTLQNQCLPLVFKNKGSAPIRFFTVTWRISP